MDGIMMGDGYGIVFPGQGSQKIGMLSDFIASSSDVNEAFEEASEVLGYDLLKLSQSGNEAQITMTEVAQPLILTASIAIWRMINSRLDLSPKILAGHSLGEWSALVCAEVISFSDAVLLVRNRGKYMQAAVAKEEGAMAAIIGLEDQIICSLCDDLSTDLSIVEAVNFNAPGQVVIAGHLAIVEEAIERAMRHGAKRALKLAVSAPFHTSLMKPAARKLVKDLDEVVFKKPKFKILHNCNCKTEDDPKVIKALMIEQIYSPVLWSQSIRSMEALGVTRIIECGSGRVLTGLTKRINRDYELYSTDTLLNAEETINKIGKNL